MEDTIESNIEDDVFHEGFTSSHSNPSWGFVNDDEEKALDVRWIRGIKQAKTAECALFCSDLL